jgi:DNA-binding IclR family transcriptional regulator
VEASVKTHPAMAKRATAPEEPDETKDDRHFVTALARGLDVLACFRRGERTLGNSEIAERCGLARSTVSRLTHTLTTLGYLHHVPESGGYRLGTALIALGATALAGLDVRHLARPGMRDLAAFSNATIGLGVRDRLSMRYIECCRGEVAIALNMDVGSRLSMARSAMGRAYLAVCDEAERRAILDDIRSVDDAGWPRLRDGVERALADYREFGCARSFGDWQPTVDAIAVAFRPGGGLPPMSINCGAPSVILDRQMLMSEIRPRLIALAASLEGVMGS